MRTVCLVCLAAVVSAALPQGYEEELYCPPDSCLQDTRREFSAGFTGPRAMFYECCEARHPDQHSRPRAWGVLLAQEYKAGLLAAGYHSLTCAQGSDCAKVLVKNGHSLVLAARMLESRVAALFF